jgi:hypothetical protein
VFDLDPLVGLGLPSYSLSSAMVLTAILTAISDRSGVFAGVRYRTDTLTGKDFRTLAYGSGRGAGNWGQGVASSNLASPTKRSTPSDLVGVAFNRILTALDDAEAPTAPDQLETTRPKTPSPCVQRGLHIGMQVASRDRRILMVGDLLQDVQIDAGLGHPCQGGVP